LGWIGNFTSPALIANSQVGVGPTAADQQLAIGPGGQFMVAWSYFTAINENNPNKIYVSVSANRRDFQNPIPNPNEVVPPGQTPVGLPVTNTNVYVVRGATAQLRGITVGIGLAWDRSGRFSDPNQGVVYLAYTDSPAIGSFDTDIYYRVSTDSGAHWSDPIPVHSANTNLQFMPAISVDETTGNVAIVWYDCRADVANNPAGNPGNILTQLYGTVIFATGQGCGVAPANFEVQISTGQSNSSTIPDPGSQFRYGDYIGVTFYDGVFFPAWADNSTNNANPLDIYTARVSLRTSA
jgi:hypothetical protein